MTEAVEDFSCDQSLWGEVRGGVHVYEHLKQGHLILTEESREAPKEGQMDENLTKRGEWWRWSGQGSGW